MSERGSATHGSATRGQLVLYAVLSIKVHRFVLLGEGAQPVIPLNGKPLLRYIAVAVGMGLAILLAALLLTLVLRPQHVGGALFLLWLAWSAWHAAEPKHAAVAKGGVKGWHAFGGTFLLTLSNPTTILSFIAVFSSLAGNASEASPIWMIAGVFIGSAAWWFLLVGIVGRFRGRLQAAQLRWLRRGSAVLLAGFAGYQLVSLWTY